MRDSQNICASQDFNPGDLIKGDIFYFNGGCRELVLSAGPTSVKTLSTLGPLELMTMQRRFFGAYKFLHDDVISWPRSSSSVSTCSPKDKSYETLVDMWGVDL